ncbi:hypothetical protein CKOHBEJN_00313 [Aeromonas hydrophila]
MCRLGISSEQACELLGLSQVGQQTLNLCRNRIRKNKPPSGEHENGAMMAPFFF